MRTERRPRTRRAQLAAEALLREAQVTSVPVDVARIARSKGIQVLSPTLEDDISGLLVSQPGRAYIAVNASHHPNRRRFTIAHELGHFVLHPTEHAVFIDNAMVQFRASEQGYDPREVEANEFAAALLMPERLLRSDASKLARAGQGEDAIEHLAKQYAVSAQAMAIRLERLNLLAR